MAGSVSVVMAEAEVVAKSAPVLLQEQLPEPFTAVILGATGDLASRKLWPALYSLWLRRCLPEKFALIGVSRRPRTDEEFRNDVHQYVETFREGGLEPNDGWNEFAGRISYQSADLLSKDGMEKVADRLHAIEKMQALPGNRLFYLATDPDFFEPIVEGLGRTKLVRREPERPWGRVVIEKPFGHDLRSARELDHRILHVLRREQIYRIDHYLGKETVQNLLAFRFGNAIFEPLFNREYVDHVQITVAETVGMEGKRGAYYDHAGALRDVVQNHLLQLLALVTMDPPATLKARDVGDAKVKVLRNLVPLDSEDVARRVVRGQYGAGTVTGKPVPAYREEDGIAAGSNTETYVALRVDVESWRWAGVPFLLRTGKRMPRRVTEIAVQFKLPPLRLFRTVECVGDACDLTAAKPDILSFRIQPDEGITLTFSAKRPGMQVNLYPVRFEFDYNKAFNLKLPEAYERLLLDALRGDSTLFARSDELEAAWEFITPILMAWEKGPPAFPNYAAGTWGPEEADRLALDVGGWRKP